MYNHISARDLSPNPYTDNSITNTLNEGYFANDKSQGTKTPNHSQSPRRK
jgi:hypothetical protein